MELWAVTEGLKSEMGEAEHRCQDSAISQRTGADGPICLAVLSAGPGGTLHTDPSDRDSVVKNLTVPLGDLEQVI